MKTGGSDGAWGGTHAGVVAVDEELGLGAPFAGRDGRRVELVKDAALALRLGVQRVAAPGFGELFEAVAGRLAQPEEGVGGRVRASLSIRT